MRNMPRKEQITTRGKKKKKKEENAVSFYFLLLLLLQKEKKKKSPSDVDGEVREPHTHTHIVKKKETGRMLLLAFSILLRFL